MPVVFAGSLSTFWLPPPNKKHQTAASRNLHPNELASDCTMKVACSKQFRILLLLTALSFSWLACFWTSQRCSLTFALQVAVPALGCGPKKQIQKMVSDVHAACLCKCQWIPIITNYFQSYPIIIKFLLFTSWQSLLRNNSSIRHSHITLPKHRTALGLLDFAPWPVNFEPAGLLGGWRLIWSEGPKTSRCWWAHPLMPFCWSTPATLAFDVQSWASGVGSLPSRRLVVGCGDIGVDDPIVCWFWVGWLHELFWRVLLLQWIHHQWIVEFSIYLI